jgi:hypothetical protein
MSACNNNFKLLQGLTIDPPAGVFKPGNQKTGRNLENFVPTFVAAFV